MKLYKNKRGIELSINFIVMLILAIASFAGGMVFLGKFFGQTKVMQANLDSQTQQQIEKLLDSGSKVVLPITTKEIFRHKFGTFGLGVLADANAEYTVTVSEDSAFPSDKTKPPVDDGWMDYWNIQPGEKDPSTRNVVQKKTLKKNEKGKFMIGMTVPGSAVKGTYIFKVTVTSTGVIGNYDNPLQMIVKVP